MNLNLNNAINILKDNANFKAYKIIDENGDVVSKNTNPENLIDELASFFAQNKGKFKITYGASANSLNYSLDVVNEEMVLDTKKMYNFSTDLVKENHKLEIKLKEKDFEITTLKKEKSHLIKKCDFFKEKIAVLRNSVNEQKNSINGLVSNVASNPILQNMIGQLVNNFVPKKENAPLQENAYINKIQNEELKKEVLIFIKVLCDQPESDIKKFINQAMGGENGTD